ncbi:hypothetical protein [Corynebacterium sp.]|uniref:hypothetical protein n=1 Tax=Corynebacterium sp. TaxID=1720 RepID=UPI0025C444A3|nr:hypothetical protein [Corynebacterium sp.]
MSSDIRNRYSVSDDVASHFYIERADSSDEVCRMSLDEYLAMSKNGAFVSVPHRAELVCPCIDGEYSGWSALYAWQGEYLREEIMSINEAAGDITQGAARREWLLGEDAAFQFLVVVRDRSGRPVVVRFGSTDLGEGDTGDVMLGLALEEAIENPTSSSRRTAERLMAGWTTLNFERDDRRLSVKGQEIRLDAQTFVLALEAAGPYGDLARAIRDEQYSGREALKRCAREYMVRTGIRPLGQAA